MQTRCSRCRSWIPENVECPICRQLDALTKSIPLSTDFSSVAPSAFVGHYGYPKVNVGILAPAERNDQADSLDAPRVWAKNNFSLPDLVSIRSSLINSRFSADIKKPERYLESAQEVAIAKKPVDVEMHIKDKPKFHLRTDAYAAPQGPNADLTAVEITSNPGVDTKVEKTISDTDLLASDGLNYLFKQGYDENFLSRILSVGMLGKERKLVPTRWSITAVDDTLGKEYIEKIRLLDESAPVMFYGGYLGNYYMVLLLPSSWNYELFEFSVREAQSKPSEDIPFSTDVEFFEGRKSYATSTVGGYYAARLPILEYLLNHKCQASVLVFRFITEEYTLPLGVWVVREATRKAMQEKPMHFDTKEDMIFFAKKLAKLKFNYHLDFLLKQSKVLKATSRQTRLTGF